MHRWKELFLVLNSADSELDVECSDGKLSWISDDVSRWSRCPTGVRLQSYRGDICITVRNNYKAGFRERHLCSWWKNNLLSPVRTHQALSLEIKQTNAAEKGTQGFSTVLREVVPSNIGLPIQLLWYCSYRAKREGAEHMADTLDPIKRSSALGFFLHRQCTLSLITWTSEGLRLYSVPSF